jgi:hypothetical protein
MVSASRAVRRDTMILSWGTKGGPSTALGHRLRSALAPLRMLPPFAPLHVRHIPPLHTAVCEPSPGAHYRPLAPEGDLHLQGEYRSESWPTPASMVLSRQRVERGARRPLPSLDRHGAKLEVNEQQVQAVIPHPGLATSTAVPRSAPPARIMTNGGPSPAISWYRRAGPTRVRGDSFTLDRLLLVCRRCAWSVPSLPPGGTVPAPRIPSHPDHLRAVKETADWIPANLPIASSDARGLDDPSLATFSRISLRLAWRSSSRHA